jgi:hypothetical protein
LTAPFAPVLHFKNPYVARLYSDFKAQNRNKMSYSKNRWLFISRS